MGSLRNPIGPLPSSIYWRRRAVALALVALLVLLVVWAIGLGGGPFDDRGQGAPGGGSNGRDATDAITPGPTSSEPEFTERPGGRDEADGGAGSGGGGAGDDAAGGGSGGGAAGGKGGQAGALAGSSGSLTGGDGIPADAGTPRCGAGDVDVSMRSAENEYEPGDTPTLELTVTNESGTTCRIDLGRTATVLTITDSDDDRIWSSDDCPPNRAAAYVEVPAEGKTTHDLKWKRGHSKPGCASASAAKVPAGTYLAEAKVEGLPVAQTSFVLSKD